MSEVKIVHHEGIASQKAASGFSTLMMCQSVSQLMEKNHRRVGKYLYRMVILFGSCFRLFILINILILAGIRISPNNKSYSAAFNEFFHMFKWSISLERARVME